MRQVLKLQMTGLRHAAGVALALCLCAGPARSGEPQKLLVATEGAYPPYNYVAADGTLQGFDVDIAKALCAKMKADCTIVKQAWSDLIPGLVAKKYDLIVASMAILPDREAQIDFSIPYYQSPTALIARTSSGIRASGDGLVDASSMTGKKVGVQRNTGYEALARAKWPGAVVVAYDTPEVADLDMNAGRLDARFDDYILLRRGILASRNADAYQRIGRIWGEAEFGSKGEGIGIRKGEAALRAAVNTAILEMRADGTYARINDRYFDFDIYGK